MKTNLIIWVAILLFSCSGGTTTGIDVLIQPGESGKQLQKTVENEDIQFSSSHSFNVSELKKIMQNPEMDHFHFTITLNAQNEVVAEHIIQPQTAFNYVTHWNTAGTSGTSIQSYLTYENEYVQYYIVPTALISSIVTQENTKELAIYWGLNNKQKLAPIFVGVDLKGEALIKASDNEGYLYDTVRLTPPFDDEGGN